MLRLFHIATLISALVSASLVAMETKALSPRDIFPPTADNMAAAGRDRISLPAKPVTPDRMYEVGLGVGVPNLVALEVGFQLLKRWQFGGTYGLLPASGLIPDVSLPRDMLTLGPLNFYLYPTLSSSLRVICPFVRYFPTERPFYFQLTWGLLFSQHVVESGLTEASTGTVVPGASVTAHINLTTQIPTLSIGHFFWRRFFFFNISLGATFLLSSTSTVAISTSIPPVVGSLTPSQEAALQNQLNASLAAGVATFRDKIAILPSLMLTTGVMF